MHPARKTETSLKSTKITSIPGIDLLPNELLLSIGELCSSDRASLRALALTSKAFQPVAEKILWRQAIFSRVSDPNQLIQRLQTCIISNPTRASLVETLRVDVGFGSATGSQHPYASRSHFGNAQPRGARRRGATVGPKAKAQAWIPSLVPSSSLSEAISSALVLMMNLKCVEITTDSSSLYTLKIAKAISDKAQAYPFQLHSLKFDMYFSAGLDALFHAQPSIESLQFLQDRQDLPMMPTANSEPPLLSPHLLPNLSRVVCEASDVPRLAIGRPVQTIITTLSSARDVYHLVRGMMGTSRPVARMSLSVSDIGILEVAAKLMVEKYRARGSDRASGFEAGSTPQDGCPLELLVVTGTDESLRKLVTDPARPLPGTALASSLAAIGTLPNLRAVHFRGTLQGYVVHQPQYAGPSLVEIRGTSEKAAGDQSGIERVRFTRQGDGAWMSNLDRDDDLAL